MCDLPKPKEKGPHWTRSFKPLANLRQSNSAELRVEKLFGSRAPHLVTLIGKKVQRWEARVPNSQLPHGNNPFV
jgi:hypothetical protein